MAGFKSGLAEFGLELSEKYIVEGAYTYQSGLDCMVSLLGKEDRPTAVFLGNDEMAMGAYSAIRNANLSIPEDISIVGYDDTPLSQRVWPPLTTIKSPIRETGRAAAKLLIKQVSHMGVSETDTYRPEIIVRGSTCSPK